MLTLLRLRPGVAGSIFRCIQLGGTGKEVTPAMFGIGFDREPYAFYEGPICYRRAIVPSPVLSVATFIKTSSYAGEIPESTTLVTRFVFREDSFDPVTRIRRGRVYKWTDGYAQPSRWRVQPYPGSHDEQQMARFAGPLTKEL